MSTRNKYSDRRENSVGSAHRLGSNLDGLRQHNLSTILGMVHHAGRISRSQLTRRSGLNRSTIAALVGELLELDLVTEDAPESSSQVGRPSSIVSPSANTVAIAVNPEVDAVVIGVVGLGGVVRKRIRYPTDKAPTAREAVNISAAIIEGVHGGLNGGSRIVGVGIAVPGQVRREDGLVRFAPHLGWRDEPIAELLADATGYPVLAANDARLGALAERMFGAGRGINDMIYLNGGPSGIGGGVINGGLEVGGVEGYAGELGHTRVRDGGRPDTAGVRGTLESEVTRIALLDALGLGFADLDELESALLASNDATVRVEVNRQLDFLGIALGDAINILNPELIILGGFLGSLYAVDPDRLERVVAREALPASLGSVRITRPALGASIFMVGAAELAFSGVLADPAGFVDSVAH
jgi:predicted NBD/HSP70 family sugar kinase